MLGALKAERVLGGDHAVSSREAFAYQLQSPTTYTLVARSSRERLDDPSVSMLDLDDDPRLSVASDVYDDEQPPPDSNDISHDDSSHRLSYLGPNLRVHSRAPWETDDTTIDHNEYSSGFFSSSKKAFVFSNSPRTSDSHRPSGESVRSQAKSKQSFETTLSRISYPRGALYALAQESLSTSSIGTSAAVVHSNGLLNRVRPDSLNNSTTPPSPTLVTHSNNILLTDSSKHDTQLPSTSYHDAYAQDDIHPYANPDLGFQVLEDSRKQEMTCSVSNGTVTNAIAHNALSKSEAKSTVASASPFLSANIQYRASAIQGREISSPISVVNTLHLDSKLEESQSVTESLSGWVERVIDPGFSLISLEEARARKRSATSQSTVLSPLSSAPLSLMPQKEPDSSDSRRYDIEGDFSPYSPRTRARSASAGAKVALQSMAGGGQPKLEADLGYGKALKHRKSGFMRLFNSGRGQDREEKTPPPPVPSLSNFNHDTAQKVPKVPAYRNFTSDLSPSPEAPLQPERMPLHTDGPSLNIKRPIPSLSINTQPQHPLFAANHENLQTRTAPYTNMSQTPWLNDPLPQSAPPNVSGFPVLKLRPVSTVFSAQFGNRIVLPDCGPSLETDVDTPGSSTKVFSPVTPGSASLSDPAAFMSDISEDSVVSGLHKEISNAKVAWQQQIWELERQVRDLKAEVGDLRKLDSEGTFCERCGRGRHRPMAQSTQDLPVGEAQDMKNIGVMSRPRARTGISSRFSNALP